MTLKDKMVANIAVSGTNGTANTYASATNAGVFVPVDGHPTIVVFGIGQSNEFSNDISNNGMWWLDVANSDSAVYGDAEVPFSRIVIPPTIVWPPTGSGPGQVPGTLGGVALDLSPWAASSAPPVEIYPSVADAIAGTNVEFSVNVYAQSATQIVIERGPLEIVPDAIGIWTDTSSGESWFEDDSYFSGWGGGGGGGMCFVPGTTRVALAGGGDKLIDDIQGGVDVLRTHDGRASAVRGVVWQSVDTSKNPRRAPVRVPVGTLGATAALDMSPIHGVVQPAADPSSGWTLKPVGNMIGTDGIAWAPAPPPLVSYVAVQLAADTDTLLANGVAAESLRGLRGSHFTWKSTYSGSSSIKAAHGGGSA